MYTDLTVELENRPGTLAEMGEALGEAGINIQGFAGITINGKGFFHLLVEDPIAAREAMKSAGIETIEQSEVIVLDAVKRTGFLGEITRKIANAGVNIDFIYVASGNRIVIGADNLKKAAASI